VSEPGPPRGLGGLVVWGRRRRGRSHGPRDPVGWTTFALGAWYAVLSGVVLGFGVRLATES